MTEMKCPEEPTGPLILEKVSHHRPSRIPEAALTPPKQSHTTPMIEKAPFIVTKCPQLTQPPELSTLALG